MVTVDTLPVAAGDKDAIDFAALDGEAIERQGHDGVGHFLFLQDCRSLRLTIRCGSLVAGPVRLRYALAGFYRLEAQLLTLRRLLALRRMGHFPMKLFPRERRASRWIAILRVVDGLAAGASQRDIAEALFGAEMTERDWRSRSDYLRLRVQRLARVGRTLMNGGYKALLRGSSR